MFKKKTWHLIPYTKGNLFTRAYERLSKKKLKIAVTKKGTILRKRSVINSTQDILYDTMQINQRLKTLYPFFSLAVPTLSC